MSRKIKYDCRGIAHIYQRGFNMSVIFYSVKDILVFYTLLYELKKKYKGVVYKRRRTLEYKTAMDYVNNGNLPDESQIMKEIDWAMHFYNGLKPKMFIAYDRTAFYSKTDFNLRITFDKNVRFRTENLELSKGSYGERILSPEMCIMEIKALKAMPLWLTSALNELNIFPGSFSKYGTAYRITQSRSFMNGGRHCA